MTRLILALLLAAAHALPAHAWLAQKGAGAVATYQVFMAATTTSAANNADSFLPLNYSAPSATAAADFTKFPVPGTVSRLDVRINGTAPGGSTSWNVTVVKNGADTGLSCTVNTSSSPAGTCSITANVSFAAGDVAYTRVRPANTPTAARIQTASLFSPTTANDTIVSAFAGGSGFATGSTQAVFPNNSTSPSSVTARRNPPFPDGGTIDKLFVSSNAPGTAGSGKQYVYTVDKNGSTTALTTTIADDATSNSDTSNSFTVAAGNDMQIQAVPTGPPTAAIASMGLRYVPTTAGHFMHSYSSANVDSPTATNFWPFNGASSGVTTTESQVQARAIAHTIKDMYVQLGTAPGAGKSRTITLRKNLADAVDGSSNKLQCTVSDTNTTCNAAVTISIADGDLLDWSDVPSAGSPSATSIGISALATR